MHDCLQNKSLLERLALLELSPLLMFSTCLSYPLVEHLQYTSRAKPAGCYKLSLISRVLSHTPKKLLLAE